MLRVYRHVASCLVTAAMTMASALAGVPLFLVLIGIMLALAVGTLQLWFARCAHAL
jgi:hypothetical protein